MLKLADEVVNRPRCIQNDRRFFKAARTRCCDRKKELCSGVIYLKITPSAINEVHDKLHKILEKYGEKELKTIFCVVESHRYRIRLIDK